MISDGEKIVLNLKGKYSSLLKSLFLKETLEILEILENSRKFD
jgi:hypothetical protein